MDPVWTTPQIEEHDRGEFLYIQLLEVLHNKGLCHGHQLIEVPHIDLVC